MDKDKVEEKLEEVSGKLDKKFDKLLTDAQKSKYTWAIAAGAVVAGAFIMYIVFGTPPCG